MAGRLRWCVALLLLPGVLALSGCGGGGAETAEVRAPDPVTTTTVASTPPSTPARERSPVDDLFGVGDAAQVVSVIAESEGATTATLTAYERRDGAWTAVMGPWPARLGRNGFAAADAKREGDNRTPSGAYDFDFAFGVLADPGAKLPYRRVTSDAIVWDDDPSSARYNEWIDLTQETAGVDPEPMYNQPAYNYGVVIAYNADRTPGLGSAIFLHVAKDGPTAGCVAVPQDQMVELLRWLDPAAGPRIVMGTREMVTP